MAVAAAPLRRAKYVNVNKLVTSQYDVDLQALKDELEKSKKEPPSQAYNQNAVDAVSGDMSSSKGGVNKCIMTTPVKKPAWGGNLILPGGAFKTTPLPVPGKYHQSRLQPPREGFNLCVLVGKVEIVVDKYRVDGSRVLVAEVEVGDETGSISLRARDDQIDLLRRVSEAKGAIVLRNCTIELYQGKHLRLGVSKWGKMSLYPDGIESTPDPPLSMNKQLNFSLVDLNIVAQAKIPDEPVFPVATVHHKHKKQHYNYTPKQFGESSSGARNRGRPQGHYIHHQRQKQDPYYRGSTQYQHQQHQHHHHHQRRPRSGSHMSAGSNQYQLQHQHSVGSASPPQQSFPSPTMHYQAQQYSDAGSVYSYQSSQQDSPNRQYLPEDHYKRQQQHQMMYHYDLQQRHAEQMQVLHQQHNEQRRMLASRQAEAVAAHSALIPDNIRTDAHSPEYSVEYNSPGAGTFGGQFSSTASNEYPYAIPPVSPEHSYHQPTPQAPPHFPEE